MSDKVEYHYVFSDGTSVTLTIDNNSELSPKWISLLQSMDKQEYNNNHAETRRCCSLEHLDLGNNLLPAPDSMQDDLDEQVLWNRICKRLTTREQLIGNAYYRQGFTQEELAKHFHISQQRVASILSAIRRKARKFVKL